MPVNADGLSGEKRLRATSTHGANCLERRSRKSHHRGLLMSLMAQFQKLDELIREHTSGEVQAILRSQLAKTCEQIEAHQAQSDKQDETLARQAKAIEELQEKLAAQPQQPPPQDPKESNEPSGGLFRVSDEFEFIPSTGYWVERKSKLRVCGECLFPPTNMVSPLHEEVGMGYEGDPVMIWRCSRCSRGYDHQPEVTETGESAPPF
jgi:hypothetical protein